MDSEEQNAEAAGRSEGLVLAGRAGGGTDPSGLVERLQSSEILRRSAVEERRRFDEARRAERAAAATHQTALRTLQAARTRDDELQSGRGALLCKAVGVVVYEFWLELPGFAGPIQGAAARLEQTGDIHQVSDVNNKQKSGLGGAVVGGLLLGPVGAVAGLAATRKNTIKTTVRAVDTRKFELEVRGPGYAWSTVQGPGHEDNLRKLRDTINARGSSGADIRDVLAAHGRVLSEQVERATHLESVSLSTSATTALQKQTLALAVGQYTSARLPFTRYVSARWARSGALQRVMLIAFAPILLTAWLVRHSMEGLTFKR